MPVNINGTTGINTPGLDSGSMPNSGGDPVVESGSNSDGSWTRWANGAHHCSGYFPYDLSNDSSEGDASWTFPVPFSEKPHSVFAGLSVGTSSRKLNCEFTASINGEPNTTSVAYMWYDSSGSGANQGFHISLEANGTWK